MLLDYIKLYQFTSGCSLPCSVVFRVFFDQRIWVEGGGSILWLITLPLLHARQSP